MPRLDPLLDDKCEKSAMAQMLFFTDFVMPEDAKLFKLNSGPRVGAGDKRVFNMKMSLSVLSNYMKLKLKLLICLTCVSKGPPVKHFKSKNKITKVQVIFTLL